MATYLTDKVIIYVGKPYVECIANVPEALFTGMNRFLSHLNITLRRDTTSYRPRINKLDSTNSLSIIYSMLPQILTWYQSKVHNSVIRLSSIERLFPVSQIVVSSKRT
ncbi:hypothetical protein AMTRI_Chr07g28240 [Amborella trichopoda]